MENPHLGDLENVIKENAGLVAKVARNWQARTSRDLDTDDLIQEGTMGLIRAYERYKPGRAKFSTYAFHFINKHIFVYIRDQTRTIKPSRYYFDIIGKIIRRDLKDLKPEEIAKELGYSTKVINKALGHLDLIETRYIHDYTSPEKSLDKIDVFRTYEDFTQVYVNEFLELLNDSERKILEYQAYDLTYREIGKLIGKSHTIVYLSIKNIRKRAKDYFSRETA